MDIFECYREAGDVDAMWNFIASQTGIDLKKEKVRNMGSIKVNWDNQPKTNNLLFYQLNPNDAFRIVGARAVYIKVVAGRGMNVSASGPKTNGLPDGGMLEIATGKVFAPTTSYVELVDVSVDIKAKKPDIYV